ncbi:GIY-YIG nuclease family protein [Oryzibacter oryziterrae]|uniref:GIY-YIG nuclease family protein n=1 Tax=Oryzibacter oryziterrae TaxID=2766474 RepID=UPI001F2E0E44|nr:GIY-YIG nuclease family protein [Oryzibacter oryziterrae]
MLPTPGAYALLLRFDAPLPVSLPGRLSAVLAPGWYAYAGSARGPGGIAARVGRHLRAEKKPHWHVDRVTAVAGAMEALGFPGGEECAVVAGLLAAGEWSVAMPGFGSSDCRTCASHLLRYEGAGRPEVRLAGAVGLGAAPGQGG